MNRAGVAAVIVLVSLGAGGAPAQVPPPDAIPNWSVPPTWSPSVGAGGIQTMTDITSPRLFVGIIPCRIADTRSGQGFSGQAGPPILSSNAAARQFQIGGSPATVPAPPNGCAANAIPSSAEAVSFQFTIVSPTDAGNLIAWPSGSPQPQSSVLNWPAGTVALGNGTILPLYFGFLNVRLNMAAGQSAHLVIDVNGYFAPRTEDPTTYLELRNNSTNPTALFSNESLSCGTFACGLQASVFSGTSILGTTNGNSEGVEGVEGRVFTSTSNSSGVLGTIGSDFATNLCCGPAGVRGKSAQFAGVVGLGRERGVAGRAYDGSGNEVGIGTVGRFDEANTVGVGVVGVSLTTAIGSAGLYGLDYSGDAAPPGMTCCGVAAVRGSSQSNSGVQGLSRDTFGVVGYNKLADGTTANFGTLGHSDVLSVFYSFGLAGAGPKSFVEPHPKDASKAIRYVSLEGNEAGTYFRGRSRFQNGLARIVVPEDFRLVTDPEGLTVQITPIGEMATYAVVRVGLDEIVVRSSRNVEFFYTVNGQRRMYRNWNPIVPSDEFFVPKSADEKFPLGFPPEETKALIENGTYNPDGTVNIETAERLGWTKIWKERREKQEAALAESRAKLEAEAARVGP